MKLFSFLFALTMGFSAHALPLRSQAELQSLDLPPSFTANYNFEGIVALNNCSGSIVRFETSKETDQAMVLTNGHCLEGGMPAPGVVVVNRPSTRAFRVLNPAATNLGTVTATTVLYATMTNTDMSLYRLKETFATIKTKFNVLPLTMSSKHPETGMEIEVISGYWKKGYSCGIEAFASELKEDDWTMVDSIRYSRPGCETIGGTSGSPVILAGTRTVIGVNNTGNEDGMKCTMNNPCEVDSAGNVTAVKGYSYGQQTYWVYSCLTENNQIDLNQEGCLLPHQE